MGAIVAGQVNPNNLAENLIPAKTSVKAPEIKAFNDYLPSDTEIVTCHSMHGPGVDPTAQPLVEFRAVHQLNFISGGHPLPGLAEKHGSGC